MKYIYVYIYLLREYMNESQQKVNILPTCTES